MLFCKPNTPKETNNHFLLFPPPLYLFVYYFLKYTTIMHTDAIICSSLPSVNSAEYALKMHLDSRIYNNAGDEMKSFFDTLVELNHYLSQGQYYIKMLYSYRGTSNTVPLKVPKEDENNADRQNEYRQALFLLLRTETMKISDLMKFCEKSMTLFKKILD